VKGHYRIEPEGMEEPLHVIWIAEGDVLNHTVHAIDIDLTCEEPLQGKRFPGC
jgi:hypothetical protein